MPDRMFSPNEDECKAAERRVLMVFGSFETLIDKPGSRYGTISWREIRSMALEPEAVEKKAAPAIIPSTYVGHDGREHAAQREKGDFAILCGDVDTGNHTLEQIIKATTSIANGAMVLIYSSSSASAENRKWRFMFLLAETLPGEDYTSTQDAVFSLMAEQGIKCDTALNRTGQVVYLPNVPKNKRDDFDNPIFYETRYIDGEPLALTSGHPIVERVWKLAAEREAIIARTQREAEERAAKRKPKATYGEMSPTEWFNSQGSIEHLFGQYGYKIDPKRSKRGVRSWCSPMQQSGSYATIITDDGSHFISLSGSDRDAGLGQKSSDGASIFGDRYDLFAYFEHGNDHKAAWQAIGEVMRDGKPKAQTYDKFTQAEDFTATAEDPTMSADAEFDAMFEDDAAKPEAPKRSVSEINILSFKAFKDGLPPPDYVYDGILQRGWIYSLTSPTGHGKTAVALTLSQAVAQGVPLAGRDTTQGNVVYFAGENADDVRARCIMMGESAGREDLPIHFIDHIFKIGENLDGVFKAIGSLGGATLIVVDTAAAYFEGDDDNANVPMGDYARMLRQLTKAPGNPTVIVLAHPTKNASKSNLLPRGGGAFLAEVDGNLTLWGDGDGTSEMHHQGKFRGNPMWEPVLFKMEERRSPKHLDSKGREMPSVLAVPMNYVQAEQIKEAVFEIEDRVLLSLDTHPALSVRDRARMLGVVNEAGQPKISSMARVFDRLLEGKFVTKNRKGIYALSKTGTTEVKRLRGGGRVWGDDPFPADEEPIRPANGRRLKPEMDG